LAHLVLTSAATLGNWHDKTKARTTTWPREEMIKKSDMGWYGMDSFSAIL
jgi:hypothetical protein